MKLYIFIYIFLFIWRFHLKCVDNTGHGAVLAPELCTMKGGITTFLGVTMHDYKVDNYKLATLDIISQM